MLLKFKFRYIPLGTVTIALKEDSETLSLFRGTPAGVISQGQLSNQKGGTAKPLLCQLHPP